MPAGESEPVEQNALLRRVIHADPVVGRRPFAAMVHGGPVRARIRKHFENRQPIRIQGATQKAERAAQYGQAIAPRVQQRGGLRAGLEQGVLADRLFVLAENADGVRHRAEYRIRRDAVLRQVISGAGLEQFHHEGFVAIARGDYDGYAQPAAAQLAQEIHALAVGQQVVENNHVVRFGAQALEGGRQGLDFVDDGVELAGPQRRADIQPVHGIVIHDKHLENGRNGLVVGRPLRGLRIGPLFPATRVLALRVCHDCSPAGDSLRAGSPAAFRHLPPQINKQHGRQKASAYCPARHNEIDSQRKSKYMGTVRLGGSNERVPFFIRV
ncbi:MAG: hypothetical protein BWY59_01753 [Verrucomicrobia bacterium ADurb.Bin345]|nr:MAG: hypothetical protein BWY59_01753 [Verrucomicrobia bacterium ADurb.Bin345]